MKDFVIHTLDPVYDRNSEILILGTMPSPKSRENGFYYSHPQNRFWRVLAQVLYEDVPESAEEKKALLLRRHIALWDVLKSCYIKGADDGSIQNPVANDILRVLHEAPVKAIFTTGSTASALYKRYCLPATGVTALPLPSTSPANCRYYRFEDLVREYRIVTQYLNP